MVHMTVEFLRSLRDALSDMKAPTEVDLKPADVDLEAVLAYRSLFLILKKAGIEVKQKVAVDEREREPPFVPGSKLLRTIIPPMTIQELVIEEGKFDQLVVDNEVKWKEDLSRFHCEALASVLSRKRQGERQG